jgi:hypothetical protein
MMNEPPTWIAIISHVLFNPLLFFYVTDAGCVDPEQRNTPISFEKRAQRHILLSVSAYALFMAFLFLILRVLSLTSGVDAFVDTQFNYSSIWRTSIVAVMAVNVFLWTANPMVWMSIKRILSPATAVCVLVQIVLFFEHLY